MDIRQPPKVAHHNVIIIATCLDETTDITPQRFCGYLGQHVLFFAKMKLIELTLVCHINAARTERRICPVELVWFVSQCGAGLCLNAEHLFLWYFLVKEVILSLTASSFKNPINKAESRELNYATYMSALKTTEHQGVCLCHLSATASHPNKVYCNWANEKSATLKEQLSIFRLQLCFSFVCVAYLWNAAAELECKPEERSCLNCL